MGTLNKNNLLKTVKLCKTFKNDAVEVHAIRNLDLEINAGDFTMIMGSSGSGKSTLLYMLSGMEAPSSGEVHLEDDRIDNLKEKKMTLLRRKTFSFVFQAMHLIPSLSVLENVVLPSALDAKSRKTLTKEAAELLTSLGLENEMHRRPTQLSGGQQQRVAIARALIKKPRILFADEPTGALNSQNGANVLDLMSDLNKNGQSIVMVTHDLKAAIRGNRLLFLKDGKLDGDLRLPPWNPEMAKEREAQVFAFLTEKGW
jgi:putative ABC transport system ATP-binding protein